MADRLIGDNSRGRRDDVAVSELTVGVSTDFSGRIETFGVVVFSVSAIDGEVCTAELSDVKTEGSLLPAPLLLVVILGLVLEVVLLFCLLTLNWDGSTSGLLSCLLAARMLLFCTFLELVIFREPPEL